MPSSPVECFFKGETEAGKPLDRALAFARRQGRLPVFGKETKDGRTFLVCDYTHLFVNYLSKPLHSRDCYHEYIIGPCHLFIDVDAARHGNPQLMKDDKACKLILKKVLEQLYVRFGIRKDQVQIIDLDSSDDHKLSRHLILNISSNKRGKKWIAWRNAQECGLFMKQVMAQLSERTYPGLYAHGEKKSAKHAPTTCIVDMQVYGRRRSLRTYMSPKPKCPWRLLRTKEEREMNGTTPKLFTFLQSSVCYFLGCTGRKGLQLISASHNSLRQQQQQQLSSEATALFAQLPESCRKRLMTTSTCTQMHPQDVTIRGKGHAVENCPEEYLELVKSALCVDLYGTRYNAEKQTVFTWARTHECELAGKKHEKNHVYYLFDFRNGVYRQGCRNETHGCITKRGPDHPIPNYSIPSSVSHDSNTNDSIIQSFIQCGKRRRDADCLSLACFFPRRSFPTV